MAVAALGALAFPAAAAAVGWQLGPKLAAGQKATAVVAAPVFARLVALVMHATRLDYFVWQAPAVAAAVAAAVPAVAAPGAVAAVVAAVDPPRVLRVTPPAVGAEVSSTGRDAAYCHCLNPASLHFAAAAVAAGGMQMVVQQKGIVHMYTP